MEVDEGLDREVIVERAEALRSWLTDKALSSRSAGALERELAGIIANDPGGYINGQRPLAGLTINDFVAELHTRNAGAVGRVKSVGDAVLKELRAAIPATPPMPEGSSPPRRRGRPKKAPAVPPTAAEAEPTPRRRGRPKGSTKVAKNGVGAASTPPDARQAEATPPTAMAPAPAREGDAALAQLVRLWPELHPHARRAVVLYASELLAAAPQRA